MLYGAIFSLLAYNFILYLSLGLKRYLFYAIYLGIFLITNLAYTGHGYKWFWPQSPLWQQWANPILMTAFGISGLLFATRFLDTKRYFPHLHRFIALISIFFITLLPVAIVIGSKPLALLSAFSFITSFSLMLIVMALISLHSGNRAAQFFLLASVTAAITASITAAAVWGLIPYTDMSFHAAEIGMVFDAIFLALALAHLFRVTEEKKLAAENMARIDPLTSLNNRRAFHEFASVIWSTSIRKNSDISIIMIDIDKFKAINDTYGHKSGDDILIQLSLLLKSENRAGDVLARWGGEEFIILLPDTAEEAAIAIAERFRQEISALSVSVGYKNINLTASFGVASKAKSNTSIDELIAQADQYLYHAKQAGRNQVSSSQINNKHST